MFNQPFSQLNSDVPETGASTDDPRRRSAILALFIILIFVCIGTRVAYMQSFVASEYLQPWQEITIEEEEIPARDGRIVSRDGIVLAQDESRYDIALEYRWLQTPSDPRWLRQQIYKELSTNDRRDPDRRKHVEDQIQQRRERLLSSLAETTRQPEAVLTQNMAAIQLRIERMLASVEKKRQQRNELAKSAEIEWSAGLTGVWKTVVEELTTAPDRFGKDPIILKEELQDHVILRDVPLNVVAAIQSQPGRFPGVRVQSTSTRIYPHGDMAAHLIGLRKTKSAETSTTAVPRRIAESGVERTHAATIEGTPGRIRHQHNREGGRIDSEVIETPVDGKDVTLTIDSRLQQLAEQLLDEALDPGAARNMDVDAIPQGATLVAMDIWTGDLLTLACSPRPSLTILARPSADEWKQLQDDPRHPLFQRPTQTAIAPGALFQIVTAAAALQEQFVSAEERLECRGYLDQPGEYPCSIFRQHGIGHGAVSIQEAITRSCSVFFYEMARRMGPDPLCDWAGRFGFGERTGIDLPGETAGTLPRPGGSGKNWYPGTTLQLAVGQGAILVTPLQVTRMLAAIGNGGYLLQPRVTLEHVQSVQNQTGGGRKIEGLDESTLEVLRRGLENVIQSDEGTGQAARIDMMTMAGKDATAEIKGKPAHVWFAGYAPARNPRVAVTVVLEHAGDGNAAAAIGRDFVLELLGSGSLRPFDSKTPSAEISSDP